MKSILCVFIFIIIYESYCLDNGTLNSTNGDPLCSQLWNATFSCDTVAQNDTMITFTLFRINYDMDWPIIFIAGGYWQIHVSLGENCEIVSDRFTYLPQCFAISRNCSRNSIARDYINARIDLIDSVIFFESDPATKYRNHYPYLCEPSGSLIRINMHPSKTFIEVVVDVICPNQTAPIYYCKGNFLKFEVQSALIVFLIMLILF